MNANSIDAKGHQNQPTPNKIHAQMRYDVFCFMKTMAVNSPNIKIQPVTASINERGHLTIGGCDATELAEQFGTPVYIVDEQTIRDAAAAVNSGLSVYPNARALYAGKAFLCLAMCHLVQQLGLGLDVVSAGELFTAVSAKFPAELIYMHGNNKSADEIEQGLEYGDVNIVIDNTSELALLSEIAARMNRVARVLLRVTPGVEPDTHHYIKTGQNDSKFGLPLKDIPLIIAQIVKDPHLKLVGLHAHIGSQAHDMKPYLEIIDILADMMLDLKNNMDVELEQLDLGGGLGIAYTRKDHPTPIYDWSHGLASHALTAFKKRNLKLPQLLLEPGRSIVGTAGVTLYRAGHEKLLPGGLHYLAVDGGMADNPRPVTYQAKYTACVANRMHEEEPPEPLTIVGKYCESGDIIVKDAYLSARTGDLIAVFGTGAYNYSMASNYNRTGRPACVLVGDGKAEIIVERESHTDLIRQDRVPSRLSTS
jgi:diaminopimelate decarboxylase